ncbi:MAG: YlbF family regulator [Lachnospiraceae bacterium]|nr:YlbF family regulator [Lachnospiraceae bacterium]
MLNTIEEATMKFAQDIQKTEVYHDYRNSLDIIKKDPELYEKVNEYRLKNFELQTTEPADGLLDKIDCLEQEYEAIIEKTVVSDFLSAEISFCRMMQDINKCITLALDFE